ncbi:sugar ABC transporter permease [Paenibacillus sp. CF384]|uniref:ABC transporter permease n=1 Tax=Paenibacillus sp. CF384 TaxID=1884382 RepID=UPI00089B1233|nr:ABC transporter permease subunit [Paenibacillus sp. CF384]SDW43688.1 putative aldouronate transport system permease protein [Paenibacillus sp. CF384]
MMKTIPAKLNAAGAVAKVEGRLARPSRFRSIIRFRMLYLMMLPTIALVIINNYLPMFGILIAFKKINYEQGILGSPWIGFENFKFLFATTDAWNITRNTLLYNIVFIATNLVLAVAFALMLNEMRSRVLAKFFQSAMFLPYFLSAVVISYLVFAMLGEEHGFVNNVLLKSLGLDPISWYAKPEAWPILLPIINAWKNIGYFSVVYLAAIVGIDEEYYEAALIDGASKWKQMTSITLPLLMPVMVIMTLLQIGRIFYADFGLFFQVTLDTGALYPTTNVIDTYVYRSFMVMGDIGMSSAAGLYQSAVGLVLVFASNFIVKKINRDNALF